MSRPKEHMIVRLGNKNYRLWYNRPVHALCDSPDNKGMPEIWLVEGFQPTKLGMDTLIHECLHAIYPDLDEEDVERGGTQLQKVLWRFFKPRDHVR